MKPRFLPLILAICIPLAAEAPLSPSPAVQGVITSAFAKKDRPSVIAVLESALAKYKNPADSVGLLTALAGFEERGGHPESAVEYYQKAAMADPAARNDVFLLDAARCALASNDVSRADGLVRSVLLSCFREDILLRARVYSAWILLASDERESALGLIRSYSAIGAYAEYAPALLFTLWWAEGDEAAGKRLVEAWPASPEAAIVQGKLHTGPSPFWYLMNRNAGKVADFAREGSTALAEKMGAEGKETAGPRAPTRAETGSETGETAGVEVGGLSGNRAAVSGEPEAPTPVTGQAVKPASSSAEHSWQQVGFFRNREYADELAGQLKSRGFNPVIRKEPRPSGTVYYSVLVSEDAEGSTAARLKDAGFESFLIIEPEAKP